MVDTTPASDSAIDSDLSGRQMGNYHLLRRLGRGAMAEVYLAEQTTLSRQIALKVLRGSLAKDASYVERFHHEARAAAQLVHANIVQIYEVGCSDGIHFIAQEYVQGLNLAELLTRRGTPELRKALDIVRQVTAALSKAAENGIVHRDIKPENIMLAASGEVKVADFGLARLVRQNETPSNLTQIGVTMGTPLYMSPEQVEGKLLDPRSDIYSLGVTTYQMLAGEPPFRGETALSVAVQHLKSEPVRLENVRPDLPPQICRIVHQMLAKDPADRYDSPRELLHDLRAVSLELFQDDPGAEFDGWGSEDVAGLVDARRQATQKLAVAMKTTSMAAVGVKRRARWAAALIVCFLLGGTLAWATREAPLVTLTPADEEAIPRHEQAESQYIYASMVGTEAAWKSVIDYFPDDATYTHRAKQQLALWYLHKVDYRHALKIFDEFARMNDAEVQSKAFGLAGQAVVDNRLGRYSESAKKLAQLWPLRGNLEGEIRALVMPTLQSNRRRLGDDKSLGGWSDWFRQSATGRPSNPDEPQTEQPRRETSNK